MSLDIAILCDRPFTQNAPGIFDEGPQFWDQGILSFLGVKHNEAVAKMGLRDLPLNECFLLFGAFACFANIVAACVTPLMDPSSLANR